MPAGRFRPKPAPKPKPKAAPKPAPKAAIKAVATALQTKPKAVTKTVAKAKPRPAPKPAPRVQTDAVSRPAPKPKPRKAGGQLVPSTRHPFDIVPPTKAQKIGRRVVTHQRRAQAKTEAARKRTFRTIRPEDNAELLRYDRQVNRLMNRADTAPGLSYPQRQALRERAHKIAIHRDKRFGEIRQAGGVVIPSGGIIGKAIRQVAGSFIAMPGGAYHLAKTEGYDVKDFVTGKDFTFKHTRQNAEDIAKSTYDVVRHPGRNPGYALLLGSAAVTAPVSAGLRGIAGAGAFKVARAEGKGVLKSAGKGVAKAAKRPVPPVRVIKHGDLHEVALYSEHPVIQAVQRTRDVMRRDKGKDASPGFMGRELRQGQRARHARDSAPSASLIAEGRRVSTPQQAAIRSVGENIHPRKRAQDELELARKAKSPLERRRHRRKAKLYRAAERYVKLDAKGEVAIDTATTAGRTLRDRARRRGVTGTRLEHARQRTQHVATHRENTLEEAGHLVRPQIVYRTNAPALMSRGARRQKYTLDVTTPPEKVGGLVHTWVRPKDRDNLGRITHVDEAGGVARVHFHNTAVGTRADKHFPLSELVPHKGGKGRLVMPAGEARKFAAEHDPVINYTGYSKGAIGDLHKLAPKGPYLYHATSADDLAAIRAHGLRPGKERKGEITGVYFGQDGMDLVSLRPGRKRNADVILRVRRDNVKTEVTDIYEKGSGFEEHVSRAPVPPSHIEYLDSDGKWKPIAHAGVESRPRTVAEARARLANLEAAHEEILSKIEASGFNLSQARAYTAINNRLRARARKKGGEEHAKKLYPTLKEQARREAEIKITKAMEERLKKDPKDKTARAFFDTLDEIDRLKRELNPVLGDEINAANLGTTRVQEFRDVTPAEIAGAGGKFRVPSVATRSARALHFPQRRAGEMIATRTRKPGSLTHEYGGELRLRGLEREDTMRLVGESGLEAQKFLRTITNREKLLQAARKERLKDTDQPIRPAELTKPLSQEVKAALQKAEEGLPLTREERKFLGSAADEFAQKVFPNAKEVAGEAGIMWVPHEIAKGLVPEYRGGSPAIQGIAHVADAINTAQKMAVLYLKPAYLTPNLIGQSALVLTRQGFLAPINLTRAVRLQRTLGTEDATIIRAMMDDGMVKALAPESHLGKVNSAVAGFYGKILDTPFRDASFLHEARRMGFKTPEQLHELLHNPELEPELITVARRASEAIIDYGRLGPTERAFLSRLIFFYPWLKGSARYSKHFVTEHPVQAAAYAIAGKDQMERNLRELGEVPEFMRGVFKVGERNIPGFGRVPLISNPAAATILGQPSEIALDFMKHGVAALPQYLSPVAGMTQAMVSRTNPLTGDKYPDYVSEEEIALDQLTGGLPQKALLERLGVIGRRPAPKDSYYPGMTALDALLQFGVGTIAPRPYNKTKGQEKVRKDKLDSMHPIDRITYQRHEALEQVPKVFEQLPPETRKFEKVVVKAIVIEHSRQHAIQAFADRNGLTSASKVSPADQVRLEAEVLHLHGRMTSAEVAKITKIAREYQAKGKGPLVMKDWHEIWNERVPNAGGRTVFNQWVEALKKKGIKYLGRSR